MAKKKKSKGRSFEEIASLLNTKFDKPTPDLIEDVIKRIEERLGEDGINDDANLAVKEGYRMAIRLLSQRQKTYRGIDRLQTNQGKAITMLAVDFMNGECHPDILCSIPLKSE